jgi:hypothetical protein
MARQGAHKVLVLYNHQYSSTTTTHVMVSKILHMRVTSMINLKLWMNDYNVICHNTNVSYVSKM